MKSLLIRGAMLPCAPKTLAHAPRVALGRLALLRRCLSATATSPPVHVDYDSFLSRTATRRRESAIRALMPLMNEPGMISLHGGMPNASTFPFQSCAFALRDGTNLRLSPEEVRVSVYVCMCVNVSTPPRCVLRPCFSISICDLTHIHACCAFMWSCGHASSLAACSTLRLQGCLLWCSGCGTYNCLSTHHPPLLLTLTSSSQRAPRMRLPRRLMCS